MLPNTNIKYEVLHMPPTNTNSLLVYDDNRNAVIFDPWGKASDWEKVLLERGLHLQAIYATHGHPDHISAAPSLAAAFNVNWYLNKEDNYLIGWGNEILDMFGIPHIHEHYKKPIDIIGGQTKILENVAMTVINSPGHTPGGLMFYFPEYDILLTGDTIFADSYGRYDFPGGNQSQLQQSIHNLYNMNLNEETYIVHGHGLDTTIGLLKKRNKFFK